MMSETSSAARVEAIPIYREGTTDAECAGLAQSDPINFHLRAFRKMGPIYRTMHRDRMTVMLAGLEANDFVWRNPQLWTYAELFVHFNDELGPEHVTTLDGAAHRKKRSILKPAFDQGPAMRYLPEYNRIFHEEMAKTAELKRVELVHFWARVICKTQSRTVARVEIDDEMAESLIAWDKALLGGIFRGEQRQAYYAEVEYQRLKAIAMQVFGGMVDERLAEPGKYDDNFELVIRAREREMPGEMNRESLIDEAYLILLAGVENTSRLLNSCLLACLRDPDWMREVRAELDAWDGKDMMALSQMAQLKATVMEAQRLFPIAIFNPKQAVEDFEYGGYVIPAGTVIFHMQVLCQFLEEIYPEPFRFRPQRFVEEGRFVAKTNGFFGGGPHLCVGRNHTLLQSPIALAQMLKYHDFEEPEAVFLNRAIGSPGAGLKQLSVRVKPRGGDDLSITRI
jgi:cytochrome P450